MNNSVIENVRISLIDPFPGHPFRVTDDEAMRKLINSISESGVMTPVVLRKKDDGRYEMISGHRRKHACEQLGLRFIPAYIKNMNDDEAVISMVDSNIQREKLLPSEKASAYKMKMDALRHQGRKTSDPSGSKLSSEIAGESLGDSKTQVLRYIRLNSLIPELLKLVDNSKIAFQPAVELSFLSPQEQMNLFTTMETEESSPSLSQAKLMKRMSQDGKLDMDGIFGIMMKRKPNQQEKIVFYEDELCGFFPGTMTPERKKELVLKILGAWKRSRDNRADRA